MVNLYHALSEVKDSLWFIDVFLSFLRKPESLPTVVARPYPYPKQGRGNPTSHVVLSPVFNGRMYLSPLSAFLHKGRKDDHVCYFLTPCSAFHENARNNQDKVMSIVDAGQSDFWYFAKQT